MQSGIVAQLPDGAEITQRVVDVVHAARAGGFRVFYTRHMSLPKEVAGVSQLSMALAWQRVQHVEQVKAPFLRDSPAFRWYRSSTLCQPKPFSTRQTSPRSDA
jgi:hypothetical protein